MGIIQSGILGPVSGKISGVVGARWKDKAYLRGYVKPANPNTAAQQTQRTKFSDCVFFAKPLVGQVFNQYTDKFIKNMSGFNFFIKRNIDIFDWDVAFSACKLTEGPLSPVLNGNFTYSGTTVTMPWTANNGNNGEDDDGVFGLIYDEGTGFFYFASAEVDRSVETMAITVPAGLTVTDLKGFIFVSQYIGTVLSMISNNAYDQIEAP